MNPAPSTRGKARSLTSAIALVSVLGVVGACVLSGRSDGEACLKDQDCLSGICTQSQCRAAPTLLDAEATGDGTLPDSPSGQDGASDGAADTAPSGDTGTVAPDTGIKDEASAPETGATDSGSADAASE